MCVSPPGCRERSDVAVPILQVRRMRFIEVWEYFNQNLWATFRNQSEGRGQARRSEGTFL